MGGGGDKTVENMGQEKSYVGNSQNSSQNADGPIGLQGTVWNDFSIDGPSKALFIR